MLAYSVMAYEELLAGNPVIGFAASPEVEWRLRTDERRVVLYKLDLDALEIQDVFFLHPADAILLAILHGKPLADAIGTGARLFVRPESDMRRWYERTVSKWLARGALEVKAPGAPVTPIDASGFAMPAATVDLQRWWLYRPLELTIKVTDACHRHCGYCSVQRDAGKPAPSTDRWLSLLDEALESGVVAVSLVGGDPLLHRGLREIVSRCASRGVQPFISTKVFVSQDSAHALRDAGLEKIQISIDSDVDAVEEHLVNSAGAVQQLFASIDHCIAAGLRVRTNSVITPYNVLLFPALARRLHGKGVARMGTSQCGFSLFADDIDRFLLRETEGRWLEQQAGELRADGIDARFSYVTESARRERFADRSFCTAGAWGLIVNSDGKAVLCDDLPATEPFVVGNVFADPFLAVWNSDASDRFRMPTQDLFEGTACESCELFGSCTRAPRICFRDAYFAYGRAFAPAPQCPKAPVSSVRLAY